MTDEPEAKEEPKAKVDKAALQADIEAYRNRNAELNAQMPEAGGIAFTTVFLGGCSINLTARAMNPYDAISSLIRGIKLAELNWYITTEKPMPPAASAPKAAETVSKIAETNPALAAQMQTANAEVPPSRKGEDVPYLTIETDIIEVLPQPDGKTIVKFYQTNDKWPRIMANKWTIERANGLMSHVTSEDMGKASKYSIPCRVYYTEGKSYTNNDGETKHYLDIEHVRPR